MSESNEPRQRMSTEHQQVRVRTSPRYGVFMALGAVVFALIAWGVSSTVEPGLQADGTRIDTTPVIGLMVVVGFVVGATVGALVAILLDFIVGRKTREAEAERVTVTEEYDDELAADDADAGDRDRASAPENLDDPADPADPADPTDADPAQHDTGEHRPDQHRSGQ
ncbi:MAG: YtxH domain-containing protein [Agrococcus casei]|uniref:YtxH domain-containing protein n=1 Tax=Agrococcus casei TaxID=343512 RepID=UPI003F91A6C9